MRHMKATRREFLLGGMAAVATSAAFPRSRGSAPLPADAQPASVPVRRSEELESELIAKRDKASEAVESDVYKQYLLDGDTRGFKALEANALAFEKVGIRSVRANAVPMVMLWA